MNNTVLEHTEYLLSMHDCVVLHGFGAFLRRREGANIDDSGIVTAPVSHYIYNPAIRETDGLLEHSICRREGVNYERAKAIIGADVAAMRTQLENQRNLPLGRIGVLRKSEDGELKLENEPKDTLTPLADWLPRTLGLLDEDEHPEVATEKPVVLEMPVRQRSGWKIAARIAACVVVAIATAIAISTPIRVENANYASISLPRVSAPQKAYVPGTFTPVLSITDSPRGAVKVDTAARNTYRLIALATADNTSKDGTAAVNKTVKKEENSASTVTVPQVLNLNNTDEYCVIVASLSSYNDAMKYMESKKAQTGITTDILVQDGRYRVVVATAPTTSQARALMNSAVVKKLTATPWVCRRNVVAE